MGFDASQAMKEAQEAEKYLSEVERRERDLEEVRRALYPVYRARKHLLEATKTLSGIGTVERFLEQQRRQQVELVRNLGGIDQYKRRLEQLIQSLAAISGVPVLGMSRQLQETLAAYDTQIAEMSRRILEATSAQMSRRILEDVRAQMASVRPPRIEGFRQPLDFVVAEISFHPQPAPEPVAEADVTSIPRPAAPDRERDIVELIVIGVVVEVVSRLLIEAALWRAQTGVWVFEELLAYFIQLLK